MTTPASACPSAPYGAFIEKGFAFTAKLPASHGEQRAFLLEMRDSSEALQLSLLVPMTYAPMFGVDVDDGHFLEAVIDAVLTALPDGGIAAPSDIDRASTAAQTLGASRC